MFGSNDDDPLSDAALLKAVRRRLLDEVSARQAASSVIHNNVYGGSAHAGGAPDVGGVMGLLGGAGGAGGEDPFDYMVDIERKNMPPDESGKSPGWTKHVRRHRSPKEHGKKKE